MLRTSGSGSGLLILREDDDTGTYESASESGLNDLENESGSGSDKENSIDYPPTAIQKKVTGNGDGVFTGKGNGHISLEEIGNGTISSPMAAINWNDFNFDAREVGDSSMSVNCNSFITPTPKKIQGMNLRQKLSESESTSESPVSCRSAPPDLSVEFPELETSEFLDFSNNMTNEAPIGEPKRTPMPPRVYLPLQASTPSNVPLLVNNADEVQEVVDAENLVPVPNSVPNEESYSLVPARALSINGDSTGTGTEPSNLSCSSSSSIRKTNNVTFSPTPVDIQECMNSRAPKEPNMTASMKVVSPSILVTKLGGIRDQNQSFALSENSSSSDEDEGEDEGSEVIPVKNIKVDEMVMAGLERQLHEIAITGVTPGHINTHEPKIESDEDGVLGAVTELIAANGVKVYIIGASHFSEKSHQDIIETIRKVQPKILVLELSENRRNILTLDENAIYVGERTFEDSRSRLNRNGVLNSLFHFALTTSNVRLTHHFGLAPGGEFRVGIREATKIPGCQITFADRPYELTVGRFIASLSLLQKVKLTRWLLTCNNGHISIEEFKTKDMFDIMLSDLMGSYPDTIIDERDKYLSYLLNQGTISAKNGSIVGIFNSNHVPGILKYWGKVTDEDFAEINCIPKLSLQRKILTKTIIISGCILIGYGVFKLSKNILPSNIVIRNITKLSPKMTIFGKTT